MEELRFASEEEAIQYLADLTQQKIKIANKKYMMDVTYSIYTEESIEVGEAEENGFEDEDLEFDSLYEMIKYILDNGGAEPSSSSYQENGMWYSSVDPIIDRDYLEKGEEKQLAFHPKNLDKDEGLVVFNSIKQGKNLAVDPDDEE